MWLSSIKLGCICAIKPMVLDVQFTKCQKRNDLRSSAHYPKMWNNFLFLGLVLDMWLDTFCSVKALLSFALVFI